MKRLNVKIDGIDYEEVDENIFNVKNNNIFLNQLSKGGRSFDGAILKKLKDEESDNNLYTHNLIFNQDTKGKKMN